MAADHGAGDGVLLSELDAAAADVQMAVALDLAGQYGAAKVKYTEALGRFLPILRAEKIPERKKLLAEKMSSYINRAEQLSKFLDAHPEANSEGGGGDDADEDEEGDMFDQEVSGLVSDLRGSLQRMQREHADLLQRLNTYETAAAAAPAAAAAAAATATELLPTSDDSDAGSVGNNNNYFYSVSVAAVLLALSVQCVVAFVALLQLQEAFPFAHPALVLAGALGAGLLVVAAAGALVCGRGAATHTVYFDFPFLRQVRVSRLGVSELLALVVRAEGVHALHQPQAAAAARGTPPPASARQLTAEAAAAEAAAAAAVAVEEEDYDDEDDNEEEEEAAGAAGGADPGERNAGEEDAVEAPAVVAPRSASSLAPCTAPTATAADARGTAGDDEVDVAAAVGGEGEGEVKVAEQEGGIVDSDGRGGGASAAAGEAGREEHGVGEVAGAPPTAAVPLTVPQRLARFDALFRQAAMESVAARSGAAEGSSPGATDAASSSLSAATQELDWFFEAGERELVAVATPLRVAVLWRRARLLVKTSRARSVEQREAVLEQAHAAAKRAFELAAAKTAAGAGGAGDGGGAVGVAACDDPHVLLWYGIAVVEYRLPAAEGNQEKIAATKEFVELVNAAYERSQALPTTHPDRQDLVGTCCFVLGCFHIEGTKTINKLGWVLRKLVARFLPPTSFREATEFLEKALRAPYYDTKAAGAWLAVAQQLDGASDKARATLQWHGIDRNYLAADEGLRKNLRRIGDLL